MSRLPSPRLKVAVVAAAAVVLAAGTMLTASHVSAAATSAPTAAAVRVDAFPLPHQLVSRPGHTATKAPLTVRGRTLDNTVTAVELRTTRNGETTTQRVAVSPAAPAFSFTVQLPVAQVSSDLELRAVNAAGSQRIARAVDVVAGDVFVINGQSNAVAAKHGTQPSDGDRSKWVRTFGTTSPDPTRSRNTKVWSYAKGDTVFAVGAVGQWGLRMARLISDSRHIPVAVINGGHGGKPISFFTARNSTNPANPNTNYGRLLLRLRNAGLGASNAVDALLWYQGESDSDNVDTHIPGFRKLVGFWRADIAAGLRIYVHQVRTSPCHDTEKVALRNAQRLLPDTIDNLKVLSTTDLNGHDNCHFSYTRGYQRLGTHNALTINNDLYGTTNRGINAPNPRIAHRLSDHPMRIVIRMRSGDKLTVGAGAAADFRVSGARVTAVTYVAGRNGLVLQLDRRVPAGAVVKYVGHLKAGPVIVTERGVGLLAFRLAVRADPTP